MTTSPKTLRICSKGHRYHKSSACPTCPVCEAARKPQTGFLAVVGAPGRRALERAGIATAKQLSRWTVGRLLELHGMGPSSIPKLRKALKQQGLSFKKSA